MARMTNVARTLPSTALRAGLSAKSRTLRTPQSASEQAAKSALIGFMLIALFLLTACGYHTAGHAITLPTNVNTIAIPTFVNNTETYKIEQRLTAAVVQEFTTRTHYRIVNNADTDADATLRGT